MTTIRFRRLISTAMLSLAALAPISSFADILSLGAHPRVATTPDAPRKGMSMQHVLKQYGEPGKRMTAPGTVTAKNPRITVWSYGKFTVYFENRHVIHTVVRR